jgi:hypothetical protein
MMTSWDEALLHALGGEGHCYVEICGPSEPPSLTRVKSLGGRKRLRWVNEKRP